jgi:hypothetical protein
VPTFTYVSANLTPRMIVDVSTPSWVNMTYDPSPESLVRYSSVKPSEPDADEPAFVTPTPASDPTK